MSADIAYGSNALAVISDLLAELDRSLPGWMDAISDDPVALALLLDDLRSRRQLLAVLESAAEARLARSMTDDVVELPDGRLAERKGGGWSYREWNHSVVAGRVAEAAVSGDMDKLDVAYAVRDALLACCRPQWRRTDLRKWGIDFADACTREKARRTVHISAPNGDQ